MQQSVRNSIASILEATWAADTKHDRNMLLVAMDGVMAAEGVTIKDVADWIRTDKVIEAAAPVIYQVDGKTIWKPSEKAELPDGMTEGRACDIALQYLDCYQQLTLKPKERDFIRSLEERFNMGKWLTVKQLAWLDILAERYHVDKLRKVITA